MPLTKLRHRLRDQTPHRRLSKREINLKDLANARNTINKIARRVKNSRARFAKKHTQISINKLRHRQQIIPQFIHQSNNIQDEVVIYLDDAGTKHFTFLVIPKSHILLM
jgi:hypothetical protein